MAHRTNVQKQTSGGFAVLVLIVVIALVAGASGFALWKISSYNKTNTTGKTSGTTGQNSATLSEECVARTGDPNICHLGAISDLSNYASEVHMTTGTGEDARSATIRFDGKGNHFVDAGEGLLGMSVGGHYYVYMDRWYDTGSDGSQAPKASVPSFGFATTAGIEYENLGKEACGKDTCFHYRLTGGMLGDGVITTLFGDQDYLPRELDSQGGFIGDLSMTVTYMDVTITPPADAVPISDMSAGLTGVADTSSTDEQ